MEKEQYDINLEELTRRLLESGLHNETGLFEALSHDLHYFPVYDNIEFFVNEQTAEEVVGYFIVDLVDGIAFLPFTDNFSNKSREQLLLSSFRYANEEDYDMLMESRKWLMRSVKAIERTIQKNRLGILLSRNIQEEDLLKETE